MALHLKLFSQLEVTDAANSFTHRLTPRARRLLAYLLLRRTVTLTREQIAFTLWIDSSEKEALGTLRRALSDLRNALSALGPDEWVLGDRIGLRWNGEAPYWLDVQEYELLTQRATAAALQQAVALYTGDLLVAWDDEWVLVERERLRQIQLHALRQLSHHYWTLKEYAAALDFARQTLALDPLSEAAARDVIALLYLGGDRAAALAEYDRLRGALQDELNVEPMTKTLTLMASITRGESLPSLEAELPGASLDPRVDQTLPKLIGRATEAAELNRLWQDAAAGHGRIVIISGEAGIGKSHLALSLADQIAQQQHVVLIGHCYEFEGALSYQALVEMLRSAAALIRRVNLVPVHRAALAHLVPDVMEDVDHWIIPADDLRAQLFEAMLQTFLALARQRPVLLLFEDVHWAAESTLDWLTYIAPRVSKSRLLVVITYRTDEVNAQHALARLERRFAPEGKIAALPLKPLSREANRELVTELSGLAVVPVVPVADRLFAETEGNPFFLHELTRGLIEAGQIHIDEGRWRGPFIEATSLTEVPLPESLRSTIEARAQRLTEMARSFVQAAAVAGRVFHYDLVRRAGDWADELALNALDDLLARGFVRNGPTRGEFAFAHHLVREALYAALTAPRQRYWHQRLADTITALHPNDFEALAYHYDQAGEHERAGAYYLRAGEQAATVYANSDAIRYLEQALALITDPVQQMRVIYKLGEIHELIGQRAQAEAFYRQALSLAESASEQRMQAQCQTALGKLMRVKGQYTEALSWLQQARDKFETLEDRPGLGQVYGGLGAIYWIQLHFAQALDCFQQQLRLAREAHDRRALGQALGSLGVVYTESGDYPHAMACYQERLKIDHELGDRLSLAKTIGNMGMVYQGQGDYAQALACYKYLLQVTSELGDRPNTAIAVGNMIKIHTLQGDYSGAEQLAERALRLVRALNMPSYLCDYLDDAVRLYMCQARYVEAQALSEEALTLVIRVRRTDVQFSILVKRVQLALVLHQSDDATAIAELESLRPHWPEMRDQATIAYEIWRLDSTREAERQTAAELYRRLYAATPDVEYRQRYQNLSRDTLPAPPPLPELPPVVQLGRMNLDDLLHRVDGMIAELK